MGRLNGMILVNLIETFERFLKEIAAVAIDYLAPFTLDDRFDEFPVHGSNLASFYGAGAIGKALCESATWLKCAEINKRFRKLLARPFHDGDFYLFPGNNHNPPAERFRLPIMDLIWQIRHTMVHNVGVITQSDALKLRLLAKEPLLNSPRVLLPTRDDLRYLKRFLDETAQSCNQRIGNRLAELLTLLHGGDPTLFVAQEEANALSSDFGVSLTVAGIAGTVPLP